MKLDEVTDLHNRRANLETVSRRAKENNFPLLTWPEDKLLIRWEDVPVNPTNINLPSTWRSVKVAFTRNFAPFELTNESLRAALLVGLAYIRIRHQPSGVETLIGYKVEYAD